MSRITVLFLVVPFLLAGCDSDVSDIKAELDASGGRVPAKIAPLPEPIIAQPFPYQNAHLRDPFVASGSDAVGTGAGGGQVPDFKRVKEHLESYPLDSIKMVGTLARNGRISAIVKVDNTLYHVSVGNHLGTDFGRVTRITGGAIEILETVQDVNNIWIERTASLALEETEGTK